MPRLLDYFVPVYNTLIKINPAAPKGAFVALVFLIVLAWRRWFPASWVAYSGMVARLLGITDDDTSKFKELLMHALQGIPAAVIGGVLAVLGTGGDIKASVSLALVALFAPLGHFLMSRYKGKLGTPTGKLPPPGDSKPVAPAQPRVFLQNEDGSPIEMSAYRITRRSPSRSAGGLYEFVTGQLRRAGVEVWPVPRLGVLALLGCLLALQSACGASAWQTQRDASNVVASVANDTVEPALLAAYKATGLLVVRAQHTREDAQVALALHQERWKPVWRAWAGFESAHQAWQNQIDAKGDPLPAAIAARKSYCELRSLAKGDWAVELPDFPGPIACPQVSP
jgi:hypothetical protein